MTFPNSNPRSTPRSRHSSSVFHYLLWQDVATEYASADMHYYPYYESVNAAVARCIAEVYRTGDLIGCMIMDHCMLDGLTVKLMNLLTTKRSKRSKVVMKRISCFMLVSVLSVSATRPFRIPNLTLPFRT